VINTRYR